MPHINKIRVNNVKYNNGTQFYDDFKMNFSCSNTLYDLVNGGGKSVLMLLLLQNLIPNCTLDEKQPVEKLFRGKDSSNVIHSLIEWRLDNNDKSGYKYMLTGFCARKSKESNEAMEQGKNTATIEYFNYCIFYNGPNEYDINNIPLDGDNKKITYSGLRDLIRALKNGFTNIVANIFDKKGDYLRFLSEHGIYESEWELIKGINKTEGHVRTYFEQNYRTSRKVIEDLLIENIIQKAFISKTSKENDEEQLAKTLLNIKDKIVELSKKKNEISNYDTQKDLITGFIVKISNLLDVYKEKSKLEKDIVKTYNTVDSYIRQNKSETEILLGKINQIKEHVFDNEKTIETVNIMCEENTLREMEDLLVSLEKELTIKLDKMNGINSKINSKEAKNYFIEYQNNKDKYVQNKELLENMNKDNKNIIEQLNELAYNKKIRNEKLIRLSQNRLHSVNLELNDLNDDYNKKQVEERNLDNNIAIYKSDLLKTQSDINCLNEKISSLRKNINIILLSEIQSEIEKLAKSIDDNEKVYDDNNISIDKYKTNLIELSNDKVRLKERLSQGQHKIKELEDFICEFELEKVSIDKLLTLYEQSEYESLKNIIFARNKELTGQISTKENEFVQAKEYFEQLTSNIPLVNSKEVLKLRDYINEHYNNCAVLGMDYFKDMSKNEKEEILSNIPFFPYSIIITFNFEKIINDEKFLDIDFGNYVIPIISLSTFKSGNKLSLDGISYVIKAKEKFINEDKIKAEKERIKNSIEKISAELVFLKENENSLERDFHSVSIFIENYFNHYKIRKDELSYLLNLENELNLNIQKTNSSIDELEKNMSSINSENNKISFKIQKSKDELEEFKNLKKLFDDLCEKEAYEKDINEKFKIASNLHINIKINIEKIRELIHEKEAFVKSLESQINNVQECWEKEYLRYYKEGEFKAIDLDDDELGSKFLGLKKRIEEKNSDLKDKEELVSTYLSQMNVNEREITNRDFSLQILIEENKENQFVKTLDGEIAKEKMNVKNIEEEAKILEDNIRKTRSQKDKKEGKIDTLKDGFYFKYGEFTYFEKNINDLKRLKEDSELKIKDLQNKERQALNEQSELKQSFDVLNKIKTKVEVDIKSREIPVDTSEQLDKSDVLKDDIDKFYQNISSKYKKCYDMENIHAINFMKMKDSNIKKLEEIKAYEYVELFSKELNVPKNYEESLNSKESLEGMISLIEEQKNKVIRDIDDMEKIKDNFETQCIQRCKDVKTELERLPSLSKLYLDDKPIQIVSLYIPYLKDDQQKAHMSKYIDDTIQKVDDMSDNNEKIKYIRNQLSLKRLFSVIVTDMNLVNLKLYKRERIAEQSRNLKYEESVGSTGQSQGIYIQFLIAIINYIKNLYSYNSNNKQLRKVMFIDNPFGAAKDIYIWEPIFEFLKINNVQLIVPARGVTPAISGKFDVNYVLGQKIIGDKQQTVVIDVRSEAKGDEVAFNYIEQEQIDFGDFVQ